MRLKAEILLSDEKYSKRFTENDISSIKITDPNHAKLKLVDENQLFFCELPKIFEDHYYWGQWQSLTACQKQGGIEDFICSECMVDSEI